MSDIGTELDNGADSGCVADLPKLTQQQSSKAELPKMMMQLRRLFGMLLVVILTSIPHW